MTSESANCTSRVVLRSDIRKRIYNSYTTMKLESVNEASTKTELLIQVAQLFKVSFSSVKAIVRDGDAGKVFVTPGKKRKGNRRITGVDEFTREAIGRFIIQSAMQGKVVSSKDVWQHMQDNYDTYLFKGSLASVKRILKDMGFKWSKGDKYSYLRQKKDVILKRSSFVRKYVQNLLSKNPKLVIFIDETWIFMNGTTTYSWNKPGTVDGVIRRPAEGQRIVILHAGSKNGFVPGAELIFATHLKSGQDYHGSMNSDTFQDWVKKQLIPGLRGLGSCIIVMDNASYHSKMAEQQPTSKWRKENLLKWLIDRGVTPPNDANKPTLYSLCKMQASTKRFVVDELLAEEGHEILRLPPYYCVFNPIELVWSMAKSYYNKNVNSKEGQGFDRAKVVWKEALNEVTPEKWQNAVRHSEKLIMEVYEKEGQRIEDVDELIVTSDSDTETEEEDTVLAVPLESVAGPSSGP